VRPIRNLVLRLGDLAIPVGLVAATSDSDEKLFRTLHAGDCKNPIRLAQVCANHEPVLVLDETETVKAWEVAQGQFLELDQAELDALTPTGSSLVPLNGFVDAAAIDDLLVRRRYHLAPAKTGIGQRAYLALAAALDGAEVVAVTRFVAWKNEQLAAIASRGKILELATLRELADVVQADAIAEALAGVVVGEVELDLMRQIVDRYTRRLQPDDLAGQQRPRVRALLEAKLSGGTIATTVAAAEPEPVPPADLETALRRTLRDAPKRRRQSRTPVKST
jgi:DNA end-binding protein Ku